jgi:hypothetical protein
MPRKPHDDRLAKLTLTHLPFVDTADIVLISHTSACFFKYTGCQLFLIQTVQQHIILLRCEAAWTCFFTSQLARLLPSFHECIRIA